MKTQNKFFFLKLFSLTIVLFGLLSCEKLCIERKKSECPCFTIYDPVCGCNDKTYGNECEAECSGIRNYTKGACK